MSQQLQVRLGVVPVKRGAGFTTLENALISKNNAYNALKRLGMNVTLIDLDPIIDHGIASVTEEIPMIENYLKEQAVDAVFMLHCDFGIEEVIARVGKAVDKPLLLWGARDDAPIDGLRIRDTQCGIFASSKVLQRYGVPFSYIANCHADDPRLIEGVEDFCRSTAVVKAMKDMRILQVGNRPRAFMSVMINEEELLHQFGIEVVPISMGSLVQQINAKVKNPNAQLYQIIKEFKERIDCSLLSEEKLFTIAAMIQFFELEMKTNKCRGAAIECWSSLSTLLGVLPCQAIGELTAMGFPVACEADISGAVSSVMLQAAGYNEQPSFFADLTIRHPNNDNGELLWHCGPFPHALRDTLSKPSLDEGGRGQWELQNGDITLCRFDGVDGKYSLFSGEAMAIDGPKTMGTYTWMEVDDWEKWERKLVEGPYIHHVSGIYGKYAKVLQQACKYIPGLKSDPI